MSMYLSNRVPTMHKNLGSVPIPSLKKMMKKINTCLPQNYQEKRWRKLSLVYNSVGGGIWENEANKWDKLM